MKTSIATVSLSGDFGEKLDAIAKANFYGVEIFENDFLSYDASPAEVGRMVRDAGLVITAFQPFRDFEGMPDPQRARAFDRAERKFDIMQELGTDLLLVCSNVSPLSLGGIDRLAADFHELGERAAKRGLKVGYEALAWGRHISDHRDAWEVVRRTNHPNIGIILDSFHTLSRNLPVENIRAIPAEKIFLVQLADAPKLNMEILQWSRHFRNMPGQGDLPVKEFMQAIDATGYRGVLSLEIFNDQFRAGSARGVAVDGQRSLRYLMDQIEHERPKPALRLPPRVACSGVEFLEFSVDEEHAAALGGMFSALGFRKTARHKSKQVTLWKQGNINLVINCETDGFAHASYISHGPSVCAIGLQVDDAQAALTRARGLLAKPFRQPVGPGELTIPAIRGVGGSLIYFLDKKSPLGRVWEIEFTPITTDDPEPPALLQTVDHIAQSMAYEEMLSWLLFYMSIFAADKTPQLDIADPAGLVRSQVVQTHDGSLRLTLNGSQSNRTQSARFLSEFFGSGVQHIALATDDIFAIAERLSQQPIKLLSIPANYYDDLEARFDLDPQTLASMQRYGILYDRDQDGEYFQIYTATFADRFFFEIVQRRGYAGFGAVNAPIRLAAQTRQSARAVTVEELE